MKTLKIISLFVLCIALIMGCAKDEDLVENQDEMRGPLHMLNLKLRL